MQGILTDKSIRAAVDAGTIRITPFKSEHINPASVDLTLGDDVVVYKRWVETYRNECQPNPQDGSKFRPLGGDLDVKEEPEVERFKIDPKRGWLLRPGIGYLMCTRERVWTDRYVPIVDGKSSIGRLFMLVHYTAGFGEAYFDGQYTLEVSVLHPLRVYPGMRIAQIRFHTMHGEAETENTYDKVGHYTGNAAVGAVGSQAWRQFRDLP